MSGDATDPVTVKCMAWACDAPLSIHVEGDFRWDKGALRFKGVTTPEHFFYPGQAIQVLHHVRTIQAVDLERGLLVFDQPLPCIPKAVKRPEVYVDPHVHGRLTTANGVDVLTVSGNGRVSSPWLDRLVANVDGRFAFANGWRVEPQDAGLRFFDAEGTPHMFLGPDGLQVL